MNVIGMKYIITVNGGMVVDFNGTDRTLDNDLSDNITTFYLQSSRVGFFSLG